MGKIVVIAEAGVNHNGSIDLAKQLVEVAAEAGSDYVKFQTFKAEKVVSRDAKKADYQIKNTGNAVDTQFEMLKKLELDVEKHHILMEHCKKSGIKFLSTAFDNESVDLLDELGLDIFKIPSGEVTNFPYLQKIASVGKPVYMSTGMCSLQEVKASFNVLLQAGLSKDKINIMHCNTEYPTPMEDVNLKAMLTIKNELGVSVGYSDHTLGIEVPIAAVAMGAMSIEKHFTLDRNMEGPDHKASLEPRELKAMVSAIRNIELAMGDGVKAPSPSEQKNIAIARRSIHVAKALNKAHILTATDLKMMRPGDGISPMELPNVIGKALNKDMNTGTKLSWGDLSS